MKLTISIILLFVLISVQIIYSQSSLQSGPMLGYTEMQEAAVWVQTKEAAEVYIKYWSKDNPTDTISTPVSLTKEESAYTATLIANKLEPDKAYQYYVVINKQTVVSGNDLEFKTKPIWRWRAEPPEFTFATGSCSYINEERYDRPGNPYGGGYEIFGSIHKANPDFMIWLGDNTYLREPDWHSWSGILHRWTHTRSLPELQPLLASTHHYAIWDDHDYGPNDSDRGWWNKNKTLKAFELFWANPSYGVGDVKGVITQFEWNDVDFFLLDNRFHRSPDQLKTERKTILGKKQKQWLKDALVSSHANFKVIAMGGQFLNTAERYETYSNHGFKEERQEIIDFIHTQNIKNVVFITGDRHHSELSVLTEKDKPRIIDITVSPLTSGTGKAKDENNELRIKGTYTEVRNYGLISFKGTYKEREMHISIHDQTGKLVWEKVFEKED